MTYSTIGSSQLTTEETTQSPATSGSSETDSSSSTTRVYTPGTTTTGKYCAEMEYIDILIATDSVKTSPTDIHNKDNLINRGVDFNDQTPSIIVNLPQGGAIIRDIDLPSPNVEEVTLVFTTESGRQVGPIRGQPAELPTERFPEEKVAEIVITVTKTNDGVAPRQVTLSVTACAEATKGTTRRHTTEFPTGGTTPRSYGTTEGTTTASSGPTDGTTTGSAGPTEGTTRGPSRPTEGTTRGPSRPTEGTTTGSAGPTDGTTTGSSGPTEGTTTGPSGPTDGTTTGSAGPTDGTTTGPSGPTDGTTTGSAGPTDGTTTGPSGPTDGTTTGSAGPTESTTAGLSTTPGTSNETPTPVTRTRATTTESSGLTESTTTGSAGPTEGTTTASSGPTDGTTTGSAGPTDGTTTGSAGPTDGTTTIAAGETTESTTVKTTSTTVSSTTTPRLPCVEIELIETLVAANLIEVTPNVTNKEDLISKGVDFTDEQQPATFVIKLPDGGVVVRDMKLPSANVVKIEVTFILVSSGSSRVVRGSPTSLPENEFPTEVVQSIIIKVLKTNDDLCARRVRLSVIVCSETPTTSKRVSSML